MLQTSYYTPDGVISACDPDKSAEVFTFWSVEEPFPSHRLRYHLGQVAMIEHLKTLAARGYRVRAAICDAFHLAPTLYERLHVHDRGESKTLYENVEVPRRFVNALAGHDIGVSTMSDLIIEEIRRDRVGFLRLRDAACLTSLHLQDAISEYPGWGQLGKDLEQYRYCQAGRSVPANLAQFASHLRTRLDTSLTDHILLSAAYAFGVRPSWWNQTWVAYFTAFLSYRHAILPLLILESDKSSYAWLAITAIFHLANRALVEKPPFEWPLLGVVKPLPAVDGVGPMTSWERRGCIFLDSPRSELRDCLSLCNNSALEAYAGIFLRATPSGARVRIFIPSIADCLAEKHSYLPRELVKRARNPLWRLACWLRRPLTWLRIAYLILKIWLRTGHGSPGH